MAEAQAPVMYQGIRRESAAFRLMKQMGWEEGMGLGKEGQGMKQQFRVKKKDNTEGIGADRITHDWSFNTADFDSLLKRLKIQAAKTEPIKNDSDSGSDSDEEEEEEIKCLKVCRPQGRYVKRERGKQVQNYSEADLKSILGEQPEQTPAAPAAPAPKKQSPPPQKPQQKPPSKKSEDFKPIKRVSEAVVVEVQKSTVADNWWGLERGFVKGGFLGSTYDDEKEKKREAFSETDQENLYNSVQNKATTGRAGLGIGDRPKKISGARWKGQKTAFNDNDEQDSEVEVVDTEPKVEAEPQPEVTQKQKKRKREAASNDAEPAKPKLKKLCKEFLLQTPDKKWSLKKLQKQVFASLGSDNDAIKSLESFKRKLSKSSTFLIEGNKICLACEA